MHYQEGSNVEMPGPELHVRDNKRPACQTVYIINRIRLRETSPCITLICRRHQFRQTGQNRRHGSVRPGTALFISLGLSAPDIQQTSFAEGGRTVYFGDIEKNSTFYG